MTKFLRAAAVFYGAAALYCVLCALGFSGRAGANDHPLRRNQVGPGYY